MNTNGALPDSKNVCSNCGEEICINDSVLQDVSLEKPMCFCSEKCRHEWMLKDGSKINRCSFPDLQNDFFR